MSVFHRRIKNTFFISIILINAYTVVSDFLCNLSANCPKGTMGIQGKCIPCQPGFYQDVTGSTSCKPCANGTKSLRPGGKSSAVCQGTIGRSD